MTTDIRAALVKTLASTIAHESGGTATGWTLTVDIVLIALSAKLAELGLRIVPVRMTDAMNDAYIDAYANSDAIFARAARSDAYRAMLAASPDPLAQEASDA